MSNNYSNGKHIKKQDRNHYFLQQFFKGYQPCEIAKTGLASEKEIIQILEIEIPKKAQRIRQYRLEHPKKRLSRNARMIIEFLLNLGWSRSKIARLLGCHTSTITNEVNRCKDPFTYSAQEAYKDYKEKNTRDLEPAHFKDLKPFLDCFCTYCRTEKMSPETFVYKHKTGDPRMPHFECSCSAKTIYSYIYKGLLDVKLADLPYAEKRRKAKESKLEFERRSGKHTKGLSIELRPVILIDNSGRILEFSHWELDCIESQKSDSPCLLVLIEKKTHFTIILKLAAQTFECVRDALLKVKSFFGSLFEDVFQSITTDNGKEFLGLAELKDFRTKTFFCHPGQPKEKAQVERRNRDIRMFIPKGTKISEVTEEEIANINYFLNDRNVRSLGFNTPQRLFLDELCELNERKKN